MKIKLLFTFLLALIGLSANAQCTVSATSTAAGCTVSNGTATANASGGQTPYTYMWSTTPTQNTQTATGLASNTSYIVQLTDALGCTNTATVTIPVTPNPAVVANSPSTICFGQTTANLSVASIPAGVSWIWSPAFGLSCATCQSTIANPMSTNTYFVTVTDVNGCTNTASVPIIVGAIPYLSAIASPSVCTGGTVQLNANVSNVPPSQMPVQWNWYPPNSPPLNSDTLEDPTITLNTTTNLYVVVTDAYGCKDTAYATVYVESIPSASFCSPPYSISGNTVTFCANISSNGGSAYWDFGDGSNYTDYQPTPNLIWTSGPSHTYTWGGSYTVCLIAINSICRDTICDSSIIILGVEDYYLSSIIKIAPNPFSSSTTLHSGILFHNATLTVYNSFGQQVKQLKNISGHEIKLQRDNLPCGLYFIRLTQDNKTFATEKLVITD